MPNKNTNSDNIKKTDSVLINVKYSLDNTNGKKSTIALQLINLLKDTLILMPKPFFIESTFLTEKYPWVMWKINFTTPNIMYIENTNKISRYSGDAIYKPYFAEMPFFLKFDPNDTVTYNVSIPQKISEKIFENKINISGAIVYTKKKRADSIALNSSISVKNEYFRNFSITKNINIEPIGQNEFNSLLTDEMELKKDTLFTEFIWEVFDRKFLFEYYP